MELIAATLLLTGCIYLLLYQFRGQIFGTDETHLPSLALMKDKMGIELEQDRYTQKPEKSWLSLTAKFKDLERKLPIPTAGLKRKLIKAGLPMGLLEFLTFIVLSVSATPVFALMFFGGKFPKDTLLAGSLAIGFFIPQMWLNSQIKKRQHNIRKDLPNIIDLLNLCVSGGLDFMLAVNRVVKDLKPCDLTRELGEVYRETQMGKSRKEALKNFAWRVDMPEVHSFVRTLVQADRMGTPMSEALNMQSEEMRIRRFQYGEEMALKAPIKLLFPLFAFILPVVLIIVGGPIVLQFVRGDMNFGF